LSVLVEPVERMADGNELWLLLPRSVRRFPADLAAVVALVVATAIAVFAPLLSETPLRIALGLPFVLFLPGYAFVAALFPEAGPGPDAAGEGESGPFERLHTGGAGGIDGIERLALSFGLSIAITPLLGLVLNFTPFGIRLTPVVLAVGGFTVVASVVAALRRWALPAEERFRVPYRGWYAAGRTELLEPETRTDAILNVVLVVSLLLAVSSVGYAVLVPKQGEAFTEFYLLTENETGELVADGYPTNLTVGEEGSLVVGIGNHEGEPVEYSVVVELQNVQFENGSNATTVLEERTLRRFSADVAANGTWRRAHDVTPPMAGERLRLAYLLYRGEPPAEPTVENAYRETHLWVNVSETRSG
jgi:uncharacterized membrane protein